jgi:hypothetical protein
VAEDKMALLELLRKGEEPGSDFLRESVRWLVQELMEAEVAERIGAGRYERTEEREAHRNGYRKRPWDTRVGTLELLIPRLRTGSYFPGFLEMRRRAEQALVGVVAEAYVQGVSTRKMEALVQSLGIAGISKSEVSRLCASLDEQVEAFRKRRLDAEFPYIWVDARYEHVREGGRVLSMAVVVAYPLQFPGRFSPLLRRHADEGDRLPQLRLTGCPEAGRDRQAGATGRWRAGTRSRVFPESSGLLLAHARGVHRAHGGRATQTKTRSPGP